MKRLFKVFWVTCLFFGAATWVNASGTLPAEHTLAKPADFSQLLSEHIQPGMLTVTEASDGSFLLNNELQTLSAQITSEGVRFDSVGANAGKGGFLLSLASMGRSELLLPAQFSDLYRQDDSIFHSHISGDNGIVEKFTNTAGGVRQDFIIPAKPEGAGPLQIQLNVQGAVAKAKTDGAIIELASGRQLTYDLSLIHI